MPPESSRSIDPRQSVSPVCTCMTVSDHGSSATARESVPPGSSRSVDPRQSVSPVCVTVSDHGSSATARESVPPGSSRSVDPRQPVDLTVSDGGNSQRQPLVGQSLSHIHALGPHLSEMQQEHSHFQ